MRLLLIDNYDSFTFNLAQGLAMAGATVEVVRNDALTVSEVLRLRKGAGGGIAGLVLSPGPGRPEDAGVCGAVLKELPPDWPVLGVCLGHQLIGQVFGAAVVRASAPVHGKVFYIRVLPAGAADPLWAGLPPVIEATRYHSLVVDERTLPECLKVTARTAPDDEDEDEVEGAGIVMALRHRTRPLWGVQFHPESVGSPQGAALLRNFVRLCQG